MADTVIQTPEYHGSLVAFEGPQDMISTQLRLLPSSPGILILPTFEHFIAEDDPSLPFDARAQILRTHEACDARIERAHAFLRESTPENKRLVFMNGGTASAQMSCISAISKYETDGDMTKAETVFNEHIQNGIAGLKRRIRRQNKPAVTAKADKAMDSDRREDDGLDDPISKAMRAADALDLETAFLQDTQEFGPTATIRPRSISVPNLPAMDDLSNAVPFYFFGSPGNAEKAPPAGAEGDNQNGYVEKWRAMTADEDQLTDPNTTPESPSSASETRRYERTRPTSAVGPPRARVESMPTSPIRMSEVPIDVRPSTSPTHKRIKSVDVIYAPDLRNQDVSICNVTQSHIAKLDEPLWIQENMREKYTDSLEKPNRRSGFHGGPPDPAFVKHNRALVRKYLPPPLSLKSKGSGPVGPYVRQSMYPVARRAYRGTVTEPAPNSPKMEIKNTGSLSNMEGDLELDFSESFRTVFPIAEDFVIHFKCEDDAPTLEAMIAAFKQGVYPVSMPPPLLEAKADTDQPPTPTTRDSRKPDDRDIHDDPRVIHEPIPVYNPDDFDPFVAHGNYLWPPTTTHYSKQHTVDQSEEPVGVPPLLTLARAPSLGTNNASDKVFHDFDTRECKTAICIQNSLRSILNIYFPSEHMGCYQYHFPLLPELSSFWRPVFREITSEDSPTTRKIDLILAIGAQKSADRGLLGSISCSLEKLGRETNGESRSGRLDLRYLIANSMQAFTSQPLANQTHDNPFTNPLLLATLIIPHLETYIATNSRTRFLILEYPAEYLSTVLALQHLIGVDLFKVAGIVDAEAGSPKSHLSHKKPEARVPPNPSATSGASPKFLVQKRSKTNLTSSEGTRLPPPSFSKANFIITSTATEYEIATLISAVWRILIEISSSYIPQDVTASSLKCDTSNQLPPPSSVIHPREQYAPLLRAATMLGFVPSADSDRLQEPQQQRDIRPDYVSSGTYADLPNRVQRPVTPARSIKADTFRSSPKTPKLPPNQRNRIRQFLGPNAANFSGAEDPETGEPILYYDPEDDDAYSQFTADERRYMPLWNTQGGPRKGNSRKAMKWLGITP